MNTTLNQNRSFNLFIVAGFAVTLVALLAFGIAPSIALSRTAVIPATESRNVYVDFLRGEKTMYANSVVVGDALSAYHLGEKVIFVKTVAWSTNAILPLYRFGEKNPALSIEAALLDYRRGEKNIK